LEITGYDFLNPDAKDRFELKIAPLTEEEYRSGHISGSRNIPVEKIDNAVNLLHDKSAPIFVYCETGGRSRQAVSKLKKMGYTNVCNIGGIENFQGQQQRGKH
jgi:rhodanese-related sulfurtransferase